MRLPINHISSVIFVIFLAKTINIHGQVCTNGVDVVENSLYDNTNQDQDGNYIVYEGDDGTDREIFLYNVVTHQTINLSDNMLFDRNPKISGDYVVWEQNDVSNDDEIMLYRISTNGPLINISNRIGNDDDPQIDGNYVVWEGYDGGDADIYMYNISEDQTINLTNDGSSDFDPQISGDKIVWLNNQNLLLYKVDDVPIPANFQMINTTFLVNAGQFFLQGDAVVWASQNIMTFIPEIYLYLVSLDGPPLMISNAMEYALKPVTNGDYVVWEKFDGYSSLQGYQISSTTHFTIEDNGYDNTNVNIDDHIVVFTAYNSCSESEVCYFNLITMKKGQVSNCPITFDDSPTIARDIIAWEYQDLNFGITSIKYSQINFNQSNCTDGVNLSQNPLYQDNQPDMDGQYVVWQGSDGADMDIFLYDTMTNAVINVSNNLSNFDRNAKISGDFIVWEHTTDGFDDEIMLYQISTNGPAINISNRIGNDDEPNIDGNTIVWEGYDGTDADIYYYDITGAMVTNLTNDGVSQFDPITDGGHIVWLFSNMGISDLIMYDVNTPPIPANFVNISNGVSSFFIEFFIDSAYVYWQGSDPINFDSDIYIYNIADGGPAIQVSDNDNADFDVSYHSNRLVWVEYYNSGESDIVLFDLISMNKVIITNDNIENNNPRLEGELLFWTESSCYQTTIVVLRLSDMSKINIVSCTFPIVDDFIINAQNLVWVGSTENNPAEIFLYSLQNLFISPGAIPSLGFWGVLTLALLTMIVGIGYFKTQTGFAKH